MKKLVIFFASLVLVSTSAGAQNIFDDNELRTKILATAEEVVKSYSLLNTIIKQNKRLKLEINQLRSLITEINNTVTENDKVSKTRSQRIIDLVAEFDQKINSAQKKVNNNLTRLNTLIDGIDAKAYKDAINQYEAGVNGTATIAKLRKIQSYGDISPYTSVSLYWIGVIQYQLGELEQSQNTLIEFLDKYPGNHREPEAMYILAKIAQQGNVAKKSKWHQLILELHSTSAVADQIRSSNI